jgi:hypothetical protein
MAQGTNVFVFALDWPLAQKTTKNLDLPLAHWRNTLACAYFCIQISKIVRIANKSTHEAFGSQNGSANKSSSVVF